MTVRPMGEAFRLPPVVLPLGATAGEKREFSRSAFLFFLLLPVAIGVARPLDDPTLMLSGVGMQPLPGLPDGFFV